MFSVFFFNDTATTEIYTLSLHDALPICLGVLPPALGHGEGGSVERAQLPAAHGHHLLDEGRRGRRSEEHTSELQSRQYLVCRLLLEKKNRWDRSTCAKTTCAHIICLRLS